MQTVFSEDHRLHFPQAGLSGGKSVTPYECPPCVECVLHQQSDRIPRCIDGRPGCCCHASDTAMTAGTWAAALSSIAGAQAAQRAVAGGTRAAFGLCPPPGHPPPGDPATRDQLGGSCFLNNAAVVADMVVTTGASRGAVHDNDAHQGNGTQRPCYGRGDVPFASLHCDPTDMYPHHAGFAAETGTGAGDDANLNSPLPPGTPCGPRAKALDHAIARIRARGAKTPVVFLGVDPCKDDPISFFKLALPADCGRHIGRMGRPTAFRMEGGTAIEQVGGITVNILEGFQNA